MKIHTIKPMELEEALNFMSEDWIDSDQYCTQTLIDCVNCIKKLLKENKELKQKYQGNNRW